MLTPDEVLPARENFASVGTQLTEVVRPRAWRSSSPTGRRDLIEAVCRWLTACWELSPIPLNTAEDIHSDAAGEYDHVTNEVFLNPRLLDDDDCSEAVATVVHEFRHAVQQQVISGLSAHPLGKAGAEEVGRWKAAHVTYAIDELDFTRYAYNALEVDAYAVETAVVVGFWTAAYHRWRRRLLGRG